MKRSAIKLPKEVSAQVFLIQLGGLAKRKSLKLMEEFRKANVPILESLSRDSLRAQLKIADKVGVKYALVLGQKEAIDGKIIIREMTSGKQKSIELKNVIKEIKKRLKR